MKHIKSLLILSLVVLLGWTVGSVAQDEAPALSDEELLGRLDFERFAAYFNPQLPSTRFTVEITAERPDGSKLAVVQVSWKYDPETEIFAARIDYLSPEELAGDVFLAIQDDIYFWNPDLFEPLKVNGKFEVFGDATVVEVVGIGFQGAYTIVDREPRTLEDGAPGEWLKLQAVQVSDRVPFQLLETVYNTETFKVVNLKLFDESGDLLHDNTFEDYAVWDDGRPYFSRQLLDNRIVPVNQTLMVITSLENVDLPSEMFDVNKLGAE